jgi:hypothetical protein
MIDMVHRSFDVLAFFPKATENRRTCRGLLPTTLTRRVLLSMHSWLAEAAGQRTLIDGRVGNGKPERQAVFHDTAAKFYAIPA